MTSTTRRSTRTGLVSASVVMIVVLLAAPLPASGFSQNCGPPLPGVYSAYLSGRGNGHPDGEPDDLEGWAGSQIVSNASTTALVLERTQEVTAAAFVIANEFANASPSELAAAIVGLADVIAGTVLSSLVLASQHALAEIERTHALIDACGDVLTADLVDVIFIATMEEELANLDLTSASDEDGSGPAAGVRNVPTAMFLLPQDGLPAWQLDATLYTSYGEHENLELNYQDGFINADFFGVATLVRNEIAHLEAHGISTGGSSYYDPRARRWVTVPGARDMWEDAMAELATGDLMTAYQEFARAYQTAVTAEGNPA